MRPSMLPSSQWPIGTALTLTAKLILPVVQAAATNPDYVIQDEDLRREHVSLFPPERLILHRVLNHGRHAICLHGGIRLVVVSTQNVKPLEDQEKTNLPTA